MVQQGNGTGTKKAELLVVIMFKRGATEVKTVVVVMVQRGDH